MRIRLYFYLTGPDGKPRVITTTTNANILPKLIQQTSQTPESVVQDQIPISSGTSVSKLRGM